MEKDLEVLKTLEMELEDLEDRIDEADLEGECAAVEELQTEYDDLVIEYNELNQKLREE